MVILPEHLHAIWTLPPGDADYPNRWSLIKSGFSRALPQTEAIGDSRRSKRERGIWQRRYWEHQIRDDADLQAHVDLYPLQPGETWPHGFASRMALFLDPSLYCSRLA